MKKKSDERRMNVVTLVRSPPTVKFQIAVFTLFCFVHQLIKISSIILDVVIELLKVQPVVTTLELLKKYIL